MAWKMSAAKRRALVKLQLRDKKGRWIEMGGGVKWYSTRLKKQVAGTVVGTKGDNALVRLNKENPTHEPALVSVPARTITVVDSKASLAPASKPGTPTDKTSAFEKPIAVANEANGAPKSNGYVKPSDSPEDWNVNVTSDGRAYVGRKDGAELYFPARSLEVGDVLVAPEGGDETKPFSIGKGWAKKGVESVNTKGPKTGTVLRIEGDRYAVVQLPDGFTVEDKKHPGEQTDLITVGLSNSVIKLTDGMKAALGEHITDTFDGNADEQEIDDSEEEQSDHVGREVPEEEVAAEEADPADVDLTDITDGEEEEEKPAPITERAREIEVDNSGSDDQTLNENGLTDDEEKMVKAYDRMAQRAYDQGNIENGDKYAANANKLRKAGEDRRAGAKADPVNTSDTPVKDPQNAPKQEKAPEPVEDEPQPVSDAEKQYDAIHAEVRAVKFPGEDIEPDLDDPRIKAAEDAEQNAYDSVSQGQVKEGTPEWYNIWNSTYHDSLETQQTEAAERERLAEQDAESARLEAEDAAEAPNLEEPDTLDSVNEKIRKAISEQEAAKKRGDTVPLEKLEAIQDLFAKRDELEKKEKEDAPAVSPEPVDTADMQPSASGLYTRGFQWLSKATLDRLPDGTQLRAPAKGGSRHANGFTPEDSAKKEGGKWFLPAFKKDEGLVWEEIPANKQQDALKNMNVWSTPKPKDFQYEDFDGNLNGLNTGDRVKLLDGQTGVFAPRKNGAAAFYGDKTGKHHSILLNNPVDKVYKYDSKGDDRFLDGYDIASDSGLRNLKSNTEMQDYTMTSVSPELLKALPVGSTLTTLDPEKSDVGLPVVKIADNMWAASRGIASHDWRIFTDMDMWEDDLLMGVRLPDHENNDFEDHEIEEALRTAERKRRDDKAFQENWDAHKADLEAKKSAESAPEPEATPEPTPEPEAAPEAAPEAFVPTPNTPYEDLGANMPTLFTQTVRGKARNELEYFDEVARDSEYDQGYRMNAGRIEVYDFDRALSSLEDNLSNWESKLGAFDDKGKQIGYTGGDTKAGIQRVVDGIEKIREAVRSAKADRDSIEEPVNIGGKGQQSDHESQMNELGEGDKIDFTDADGNSRTYVKNSEGLFDEIDGNLDVVDDNLTAEDLAWQHRMDTPEVRALADLDTEDETGSEEAEEATVDAPIVSRYAGQAKSTLAKALEGNPDSGIELDGNDANVSDIDKAQDFLRDLVGDIQAKIDDPAARKAGKVQNNKIIRDLRGLLNDVNAKQIDRDGSPRPNKALRNEATEETPEATPEDVVDAPETPAVYTPGRVTFGAAKEAINEQIEQYGDRAGLRVLPDGKVEITDLDLAQQSLERARGVLDNRYVEARDTPEAPDLRNAWLQVGELYTKTQTESGERTRAAETPEKTVDISPEDREKFDAIQKELQDAAVSGDMEAFKKATNDLAEVMNDVNKKNAGTYVEEAPQDVADAPEAPAYNERGLTEAEEEQYEQHLIDADVEARAGDDYGVQEYRDKAEAILQTGQKRLSGESAEQSSETPEYEVYTEDGPGRVPAYKATIEAFRESGEESIRIPLSDATKKDFSPEDLEARFSRTEKTGLHDPYFERMGEYRRWKDESAPEDHIEVPEEEESEATPATSGNPYNNLKPSPDQQEKLDAFDKQMADAVESEDDEAFDKVADEKFELMEEIRQNPSEETATEESTSEDSGVHPLDELGIERRTPEAIAGEDYAPTQQQQDVIDAVLGGLDTKVQAMAGTGKTSTLVALSRRIGEKGGQAIYIAFNKTVQEEAVRRMKGLPVEAKTGHGVAHTWASKNMPHLTTRLGGFDPLKPVAFYKNGKPSAYAKKKAWTSASSVGDALGIKAGDVKEESGAPKTKAQIVLAVKKTVERYALSDKDTISTEHVPDTFEIAEAHLPKVVEFANEYWEDLKREDGNFRVTHDVYRKFWALSRPDLTDGTGGNTKGANILYIDEAQDTPPVLAKVVADQKMQKVIVGDANQAIYAFAENIDYLSEADGDIELPLNKSWRFGPEVADAGNRFLQMLGSDNRVVGGGGPSTVTYGMENADAVLVRTNAGMIHAILDEANRDRRVTAPNGTRANLESLVETVEALKEGYEIDTPHDDLIGFKNWEAVLSAHFSGDRSVSMIAKLFDVIDKRSLATLKPNEIAELREKKMADAKKAIDHLVIDVPLHNTLKLVQEGDRTYLEAVDENPFPVDEKGKQKPWGPNEKKWAAKNFSQSLGVIRKPYLKDRGLSFGDQMMKYHKEGGIETVGWKYDRGRYYTEDENVVKKFATYSGESDVTISTAHKSKGLEWDRVRIGDDFIGPYEDAKTGAIVWPEDDEYKLGYVALTRAAKELDPGSLSYVYEHTQPNGGVPGQKKNEPTTEAAPEATEEVAPEVVEDTAPEPQQIAEEPLLDSTPDTDDVLDEAAKVAPAPVEETEDGEPVEAPFYDDITGLTVDEEAHKDSLLAQVKEARQRGDWNSHGQLTKEVNKMFDIGRERWKAAREAEKQNEEPTTAPEPVVEAPEPEVTPEAPAPKIETPKPAPAPKKAARPIPAPAFDDEGLTPEEAARVANLEKWINDVYKGYGQGNVRKMENEVNDLLERGQKRLEGHPEAKLPVDITPEFETPAAVADAPSEAETPSLIDGVSVAAPAPKPKKVPTGRKRGAATVADANGDLIKNGDIVTHKKYGPVTVTGMLPGAGRINFIDPKTGKESSVKGDAVSLKKDEAPAEAPLGILTGTPGDRLMDPNSGKKAFIGGDGLMIVTGERVKDTKTGEVGIVQTVYTGADKKASVPVIFPGNSEPRRVRGTVLVHASNGGSDAPETAPLIPEAPEPAPEAPKAPEAPEPTPEAPKAPEPAPVPAVDDEKMARRRAAIGNAIDGSEVRSKDGSEVYTKLTADFWENADQTDSFTDDEVMDRILNGERDGKGYIIRTPNPAPEPEPSPAPEPTPEPEAVPEPDAPLSGQELADTLTYESTLHMSDGDLAEMMSRYADDAIVFDKIMEIMDERDANVFLEVDTSKTGATFEDQPALFDVPEPVAKAAAKPQRNLTPQQKASEEYQHYVMSQYNKALEDLNGVLLNDAGKAHARGAGGTDLEINIFSGSASIARKYASEELLQWWLENGRETLGSFRFGMYGWDNDRKAAQTVRNLGYKRGQTAHDRSNA